ncbi:MAG: hypothetical protein SGARI_002096 [Bacillariaceae sp.]
MRSEACYAFVLCVLFLLVTTTSTSYVCSATPSPSTASAKVGTCAAKNISSNNNNNGNSNNNIFGVPEAKLAKAAKTSASTASTAAIHELRGGDLHEPETLQEVEALVLNAATNRQLVVIDFTASWCGPCKAIAPLYQELSEEFGSDGVVFLKVDVDENPDTAAKYSVSAMPTFVFISGGSVVDRLMGVSNW